MENVVDPEAGALDFEGLTALLSLRAQQVRDHHAALRNALLRGHGAILSDRDRSLISNMLHVIVTDIGESFRRALAARRAEHNEAAEVVAGTLDDRWAGSMQTKLAKIGAIGDIDLIAAVEHRMLEHLLETARSARNDDQLSPETPSVGVDPLGLDGIAADIRLAKAVSDHLVERSRRFDGYRNPRLPLHEIPEALAGRLLWASVAVWREDILPDWQLDEADLDDTLENAAGRALEAISLDTRRLGKAAEVADALADAGRLSATLLPDLLRQGEVGVFEAVLARLLDLPVSLVRTFTFEPGGARLAVALRAAGLASKDFDAIAAIIGRIQRSSAPGKPSASKVFDRCLSEAAERIVRHWRRRPEYLSALRRYSSSSPESA